MRNVFLMMDVLQPFMFNILCMFQLSVKFYGSKAEALGIAVLRLTAVGMLLSSFYTQTHKAFAYTSSL